MVLLVATAFAQAPVTFTIKDFSRGMTPVAPPYSNDPEVIVLSENMYSNQPGGRQIRFGLSELVDYDSVAADTVTAAVDALGLFIPANDSGSIIVAAGGKWYEVFGGERSFGEFGLTKDTTRILREIAGYPDWDSVETLTDSLIGYGSKFLRHLRDGDVLVSSAGVKEVVHVISDTKLKVSSASPFIKDEVYTQDSAFYTRRLYVDTSTAPPFILQSGEYAYTGNIFTPPSIIYEVEGTPYMRPLDIVDSFPIDTVYSLWGGTDDTTALQGGKGFYTTDNSDTVITSIKIVSRSKLGDWSLRDWSGVGTGNANTFYARLGFTGVDTFDDTLFDTTWIDTTDGSAFIASDTSCGVACTVWTVDTLFYRDRDYGKYFQILDNDDTSLTLMAWYVDHSLGGDSVDGSAPTHWNESVFDDRGVSLRDTLRPEYLEGAWGYIYSAAGEYRIVVPNSETSTAIVRGGGGVFAVPDTTLLDVDDIAYDGLHFLHVIEQTQLSASIDTSIDGGRTGWERLETTGDCEDRTPPTVSLGYGDTLVVAPFWTMSVNIGEGQCIHRWKARVFRANVVTTPHPVTVLAESYYPLRYAFEDGDSTWFVSALAHDLSNSNAPTITEWEIVKVGMPNFAGMEEWYSPPQLVGWGDTTSLSWLHFSGINDPWAWSGADDFIVGRATDQPIVGVVGYDDQLVIFRDNSTFSFDGGTLTELSQSDGLVGRRAVIGLNKDLYWLDVDGVNRMSRRDFSGYTIEKISKPMDPVFNSWNAAQFGSDVTPFTLDPAYRHNAVMAYNYRDNHLYLFFTLLGGTTNQKCMTYDIEADKWDGYFDIAASDAMWAVVDDTARLILGGTDSTLLSVTDYTYADYPDEQHGGINTELRSGKFWIAGEDGWPYESKFLRAWFLSRSAAGMDSSFIQFVGDDGTDTWTLDYSGEATPGTITQVYRSTTDNISRFWQWKILVYGDSSGVIFQPYELHVELAPMRRDD
jgi:hypothetical protein